MEKEEIQNNTSADQNEGTVKENDKPKENLAEENKQEIVFILGQARTGTTLVEKIISSHSNVFSLGENKYLENIIFNQEKLKTFYETNILKTRFVITVIVSSKTSLLVESRVTKSLFNCLVKILFISLDDFE